MMNAIAAPPAVLIVDDTPQNIRVLEAVLQARGYRVMVATSGAEALTCIAAGTPDLVLLDVIMPEMDGYEVCRRVRENEATRALPVVMITASGEQEKVRALEAGADDFLLKPFEQAELLARVRSLVRIKQYHDTIRDQADQLAAWNRELERRVDDQVEQIERLSKLRRFLAPQIAELVVATPDSQILESHRRDIAAVACGLAGFAAFSEIAEPELVSDVLADYHAALGEAVVRFDGTVERLAGDLVMVLYNDPLPCPDAPARAVQFALTLAGRIRDLARGWAKLGYSLGFRAGIAQGYATIGQIGFEGRQEYAAIGPVTGLAEGLCREAAGNQILVTQRIQAAVELEIDLAEIGDLVPAGFRQAQAVYEVKRLRPTARAAQGTLSKRETEVAILVAQGLSNKQIAEGLTIGVRTVETHVENALNKLGFDSRLQLALWVTERGLAAE